MKSNQNKAKKTATKIIKLLLRLFLLYGVLYCMFLLFIVTPYEDSTPSRGISSERLGLGIEMFQLFYGFNAILSLLYCKKSRAFSAIHMVLCVLCLMRYSWLLTL